MSDRIKQYAAVFVTYTAGYSMHQVFTVRARNLRQATQQCLNAQRDDIFVYVEIAGEIVGQLNGRKANDLE